MNIENMFPDYYPSDLYNRIIADGAGENTFEKVFRVAVDGNISRDTFLSTIEESNNETISNNIVNRDLYLLLGQKGTYDIGDYSVSFYEKRQDARKILRLKKRYSDGPVLIFGKILSNHGLSIRTKDSTDPERKTNDSHIDLWKYKTADLTELFEKEEVR